MRDAVVVEAAVEHEQGATRRRLDLELDERRPLRARYRCGGGMLGHARHDGEPCLVELDSIAGYVLGSARPR
jgi:hypothetical protein